MPRNLKTLVEVPRPGSLGGREGQERPAAGDPDRVLLVRLESAHLRVDIAPGIGGRIVGIVERSTGHEFLWRNPRLALRPLPPGSAYDPNFYGGIDELLPNDVPENIGGIDCPDHGELWTTPLACEHRDGAIRLAGTLPLTGLVYEKQISLRESSPHLDIRYRITNPAAQPRAFMWKLHAAIAAQPGDVIDCPARTGQVADAAWSRFSTLEPFAWPVIEGQEAHIVPAPGPTCDFFYLSGLETGRMAWRRPAAGLEFCIGFDTAVFPYAWLFSSYGGLDGHFTAVLEPCTTMPISVNEALRRGQCTVLDPGRSLETTVSLRAGPLSTP